MRHRNRVDTAQKRRQRIDRIYEHLDDVVDLIGHDPELQDEVLDWMDDADQVPASSVLSHVEQRLAEFETNHEMYAVDVDGESYFPDDCSDCEHYGVACPVLTKREEQIERERLRDRLADASEEEVKRELRRYGGRTGCTVIIELIDEWETDYESLLERGRDLRRRTLHLLRPADESERADTEVGEALADGGDR